MAERYCLFFLFMPLCCLAQWRGPQFEYFGAREGLHSDDIRAICQDPTGYIYFGGYQQLIRYDGRVFEDFTHDPKDTTSIGPGQISQMLVASDGMICLTMRRDGLNIYDPVRETFSRHQAPVKENALDPIIEDERGDLWMGADGFTLLKFSRSDKQFTTFHPNDQNPVQDLGVAVTGIVQDVKYPDILWITAYNYLPLHPGDQAVHELYRFDRETGLFTKQNCTINVMLQDDKRRLWGGSWDSGLWRYDPVKDVCENMRFDIRFESGFHPGDGVFAIYPMQEDYWVGSRNAILKVTDSLKASFILKDINMGGVTSFFKDRIANTWIGTSNGLHVMHPGSQHIDFFSLSMFGSAERIFPGRLAYRKIDNSIYLINRSDSGIFKIPLDREQSAEFIKTPFPLSGIAVDPRGQILVAAENGLYQFQPHTNQLNPIRTQLPQADKIPWLWSMPSRHDGLIAGLGMHDFFWFRETGQIQGHLVHRPGTSQQTAHSRVFFTNDNHALLSGGTQMYKVDLETGAERILQTRDQGHLIQDHEGLYWIGTINHIGRYKKSGDSLVLIKYFTVNDGLTNITASHLHVDSRGRVWIFSNSGMSVIDPSTYQTRNIGVQEGLPMSALDPVQVIDLPDGKMATVNSNGIILFHPDSLWNSGSRADLQVVIKTLRIAGHGFDMGRHINFQEHVDLRPDQHTLDIQFQGLAFPRDRHVVYSYQVKGLHDHWIPLGQNNSLTLSRLPPGHYVFQVKAGEPDSPAPVKAFSFSIARPIYLQTWFYILIAILLIGSSLLFFRYRIRQIRRREEEKMKVHSQIAELELQVLRSQMNPHFMFNSLNSIKNYILKHESAKAAEYLSGFAHLIRLILHHSREKTISLQEELEMLLLYIDLEKLRFREGFEFICEVDERIDATQVQIPPMIIQPYIENAIWHGLLHKDHDRCLALRITSNENQVTCEVEDNGIGRAEAAKIQSKSATRYKSMGMGITQDRITLMNSMSPLGIHIELIDKLNGSGYASGTIVKIHIPHARHTN